MQKVHGAEQIAAERDKENNVVSDITVGNVCKQQWNEGEKTKQIDRIKLDTKLNLIETRKHVEVKLSKKI